MHAPRCVKQTYRSILLICCDPWHCLAVVLCWDGMCAAATAVASTAGMMVCRLCGAINDHMFLKCPKRSSMGKEDFEKKSTLCCYGLLWWYSLFKCAQCNECVSCDCSRCLAAVNSEGAAPTDDGAPSRPGLLPRPAVSTGKVRPPPPPPRSPGGPPPPTPPHHPPPSCVSLECGKL
jgi:hypothetical protein